MKRLFPMLRPKQTNISSIDSIDCLLSCQGSFPMAEIFRRKHRRTQQALHRQTWSPLSIVSKSAVLTITTWNCIFLLETACIICIICIAYKYKLNVSSVAIFVQLQMKHIIYPEPCFNSSVDKCNLIRHSKGWEGWQCQLDKLWWTTTLVHSHTRSH